MAPKEASVEEGKPSAEAEAHCVVPLDSACRPTSEPCSGSWPSPSPEQPSRTLHAPSSLVLAGPTMCESNICDNQCKQSKDNGE